MLGVPCSTPGRVLAQLVRALTGWARRLVPCLGSPVQPQAGSLPHILSSVVLFSYSLFLAALLKAWPYLSGGFSSSHFSISITSCNIETQKLVGEYQ